MKEIQEITRNGELTIHIGKITDSEKLKNDMDIVTKEQRSYNMSRIKSKDTKPELIICSELDRLQVKYEKHFKTLGKPDIAFPEKKIAVFINGEYWHGRYFSQNKNKYSEFWKNKIGNNIKRDKKNYRGLKDAGWNVLKFWDTDVEKRTDLIVKKIVKKVESV